MEFFLKQNFFTEFWIMARKKNGPWNSDVDAVLTWAWTKMAAAWNVLTHCIVNCFKIEPNLFGYCFDNGSVEGRLSLNELVGLNPTGKSLFGFNFQLENIILKVG